MTEEIENRVNAELYYAAYDYDVQDMSKENVEINYTYFYGVEVSEYNDISQGTGKKVIPKAKYAVFNYDIKNNTLNGESLNQPVYDYIDGIWIPNSGFELSATSDYEVINRIDKELANQLPIDIDNNYFFEHFYSIDDFLTRGIGFCVKYNNRIISAVTSMAASNKMINIEIETRSEFRNKNLGTAVSAKLLLYYLENDIEAQWLAANEISEKLALKLGYIKDEFYKTLLIN